MKFRKIIALCLAVCAALALASCSSSSAKTNVTFSISAGSTAICSGYKVSVEKKDPVVLDAINAAIDKYGLKITFTSDESRINGVNEYTETVDGEDTYFWSFTVNGNKPTAGDSSKITTYGIKDGDEIGLVFYRYNSADNKDYVYDDATDRAFTAAGEATDAPVDAAE